VPLLHTEHAFSPLTESQPLAQPAQILLHQGVLKPSEDGEECGHRGLVGRTAIVDPAPVIAREYQTSLGEDFQVTRDVRLRFFQRVDEFTVTEFNAGYGDQEVHQPQANRLAQRFEVGPNPTLMTPAAK
jgi:hypothetical protein